jgi:DegV family protein with EDD domain
MRILTDSAADYEWAELKEAGIEWVPIRVYFGEEEFSLEGDDFKARFFEEMAENKVFPHTSQPSPQDYLPIFEEVKEQGDSLVAVLISSGLSGTYQSAVLAKEMVDYEHIYLVDSRNASSGERILLEEACRMRDEGVEAKKIEHELTFLLQRIRLVAIIDDLENLHRGGRLTRLQTNIGKLTNLKPIITLDAMGKIQVLGRYMGRNRADAHLLKFIEEKNYDPEFGLYFVYAADPVNSDKLIEKAKNRFGEDIVKNVTHLGATIGAHAGARAYGVFFVEREEANEL